MAFETDVVGLPPGWHARPPADAAALDRLRRAVPVRLPRSYLAFLRRSDGGAGMVRGRSVKLLAAAEVHLYNDNLAVYRSMPGALLIGTDGGNCGYLLDGRRGDDDPPILYASLGELDFDEARRVAASFAELMAQG